MDDALDRELRALGRSLTGAIDDDAPAPATVATVVLDRLHAPEPTRTRPALARRIAVVAAAVLIALGLTPPVRAAVGEWLGIGAVAVRPGPSQPSAAPPPAATPGLSLDAAARLTGLTPVVPPVLGRPNGVEVSDDHRILSLTWGSGDETIRLDQFTDELAPVYLKTSMLGFTSFRLTVADHEAWWFSTAHDLVLLAPDGTERTQRIAGPTLVWLDDDVTFRLEGTGLAQAARIAESALGTG
ncbi:hypothetical protein [Jiangella anatolica]|uniref:DUF4367 domain-containing protein n=1 Tax=Jiangella anatolica TaxID=2670374 RepID=A0A2W2CBS3_9ACTN|nr:hypothetical protein [Jiangella anatolica]PZF85727.1 hypothetical protein C1I92_03670 [Jiangella anatolica]